MKSYNLTTGICHCQRCHKNWMSLKLLKTGIPPVQCSQCKQYNWQTPSRDKK